MVTARVWHRLALSLMLLSLFVARPLGAQRPAQDATGVQATREELQSALQMSEDAARSLAYSPKLRERARQRAAALRTRLQQGDFRSGDPIMLMVEDQPTLTDTFVVASDRTVSLPTIGKVPLFGVLRSELEPHLTENIARYIRDPIVTAGTFMRLSVAGGVGQPGFYLMSPNMPLTDALMVSGLTETSKVEEIEIVRQGRRLLGGAELQLAIWEGSTLEELGIRSGDQILVPTRPALGFSPVQLVRNLSLISTFLFALNRIF